MEVSEEESTRYVIFSAGPFHSCPREDGTIVNEATQTITIPNPIANLTFGNTGIRWIIFSVPLSAH